MARKYILNVNVALSNALNELFKALGDACAFSELGESVTKIPTTTNLPEADVLLRFMFGKKPEEERLPTPWELVGSKFGAYSARYSLLGMITASEVFLGQVWLLTQLIQAVHKAGGVLPSEGYNRLLRTETGRLRNIWLGRLLSDIGDVLRIEPSTLQAERESLLSLYNLRNCLIHRGGIVGREDAPNGALTATWRKIVILVDGVAFEKLPTVVSAGSKLAMPVRAEQRTWKVGDAVTLSARDCNNIAATLALLSVHLRDVVQNKAAGMLGSVKARGGPSQRGEHDLYRDSHNH